MRLPPRAAALLLLASLASCAGRLGRGRPISPEARQYVDTAVAVIRAHAFGSEQMDWALLRQETLRRAEGARTPAETHEAVQWLITRVNPHGTLLLPDLWARLEKSVHDSTPLPSGRLLPDGIGYLALPSFTSSDTALVHRYARRGHQLIRRLAAAGSCAWILDLRGNTGGDVNPMLLAVGPLLGEGPAGFSRAGVAMISVWGYQDGRVWIGRDTTLRLAPVDTVAGDQTAPVAVLTGSLTASAAEAIAISFRGLPRATSFGASSAGMTTGNRGYRLADGAYMLVTESVLGDRLAREYGGRLVPDHRVSGGWANLEADAEDATTAAATRWLVEHAACPRTPARADRSP